MTSTKFSASRPLPLRSWPVVRSFAMCGLMLVIAFIGVRGDADFGAFTAQCICLAVTIGLAVGVATSRVERTRRLYFGLQCVVVAYALIGFLINRH